MNIIGNTLELQQFATKELAKLHNTKSIHSNDHRVRSIFRLTPFVVLQSKSVDYKHRLWHIVHDNPNFPVKQCVVCGKHGTLFSATLGEYSRVCSNKCLGKDPENIKKKTATTLKNFGTTHHMKSAEFVESYCAAIEEKYGEGVRSVFQIEDVKQKSKATNLANLGVENPSHCPEVVEKIRQKALARDITGVMEKRKATNLAKFGCVTNKHRHITPENVAKLYDNDYLLYQYNELQKSCSVIGLELGVDENTVASHLSKIPGFKFVNRQHSSDERAIVSWLAEKDINYELHNRKLLDGKEIDILLTEYNFVVELNGLYFHQESFGKGSKFHLSKTEQCADKNIQLMHLTDLQWQEKQDIVKSNILRALQKCTIINVNSCKLAKISRTTADEFLNANHIQSAFQHTVAFGLYDDNDLYAVATFTKVNANNDWKLTQYCERNYTTTDSGINKLVSHFVSEVNPNSLISHVDRRWSNGVEYEQAGFIFSHYSKPTCEYVEKVKSSGLRTKRYYRRYLLPEIAANYDTSLTVFENLRKQKLNRTWNCGRIIYKWVI